MLFDFKNSSQPTKINSLKDLEPKAKPKWFKICFWAVFSCFPFLVVVWIGNVVNVKLLQLIGTLGFFVAFTTPFVVRFVPLFLRVLSYWWPWLGLKTAQLDTWLQNDLDLRR